MDPAPEETAHVSESGPLNLQNRLGETHLGNRRHERALQAFQAALEGGEDSVRAYSGLSRSHLGMGDRLQAGEALQRAASLDTSRAEVPFARAELLLDQYLETHRGPLLDAAVAEAQRAVRLDPGSEAYFYTLGNLYTHRGDLDSAEVAYRRSLSLDPALAPAYERNDHDGDLDLFVANGHAYPQIDRLELGEETYSQPNQLFENRGDGTFGEVGGVDALALRRVSCGSCAGDYDNDGDFDLLVLNLDDRPTLLRNDASSGNWLLLNLIGQQSNRSAVGARVTAFTGRRKQVREVAAGSSFLGGNDLRVHFGLGTSSVVDSVRVDWPSGVIDRLYAVRSGRSIELVEGAAGAPPSLWRRL